MRTLKCKAMAQMISLYVAGDLEGARECEVAAHLAACEPCRRLAEVFSRSSSLLTEACQPPEFDAEFYAGIRRAVLGEITRDRMESKPSFFSRRWLYATAFAAVVIAAGLMLQHFATRRQKPEDLVVVPRVIGQPTSVQAVGTVTSSPPQLSELPQSPRKLDGLSRTPRVQAQKILARLNASRSSRQFETTSKADALMTTQTVPHEHSQIAQSMWPATSASTGASTGVSRAVLDSKTFSNGSTSSPSGRAYTSQVPRIEIQTADPNIRIIWLAPQESRAPEETNHDPDQHKNGNRR